MASNQNESIVVGRPDGTKVMEALGG
jgi:hypothetical protein